MKIRRLPLIDCCGSSLTGMKFYYPIGFWTPGRGAHRPSGGRGTVSQASVSSVLLKGRPAVQRPLPLQALHWLNHLFVYELNVTGFLNQDLSARGLGLHPDLLYKSSEGGLCTSPTPQDCRRGKGGMDFFSVFCLPRRNSYFGYSPSCSLPAGRGSCLLSLEWTCCSRMRNKPFWARSPEQT